MDSLPGRSSRTAGGPVTPDAARERRQLVITSMYTEPDLVQHLGREAYSYSFVYRAFAPLLERWGRAVEVLGPRSELKGALRRARQEGREPVHLSFLPLHLVRLVPDAPNIVVPAWEFPDIPCTDLGGDPRHNWARIADEATLLITHTDFARDAFVRAGVRTPVHVVPVPIAPAYLAAPAWQPGQCVVLNRPCYVFPRPESPLAVGRISNPSYQGRRISNPSYRAPAFRRRLRARAAMLYRLLTRRLPTAFQISIKRALRAAEAGYVEARRVLAEAHVAACCPLSPALALTGVVYSTILNPLDGRKNWEDLLSGFLLALGDRDDAVLLVKLIVSPDKEATSLHELFDYYGHLGLRHRCKLAFMTAYLSELELLELTRASTYYVNTSRAEGSCLPLQNFLASGRPAVAPGHTGMADSVDAGCGFVIASHPEPACWPQDPEPRAVTTWHRLVWQSLHDQFRASYEIAHHNLARYHELSRAARARMEDLASAERVWPRLAAALDEAEQRGWQERTATAVRKSA
jgi:glycosyltransferase involved in cell wall biosynthesis